MFVVGIGDNVIDRYQHTGMGYPGGNALNFSVYAAMLQAESAYLGIFASDNAADHLRKTVAAHGVDITHCLNVEGESGYASLTVDEHGERRFLDSNAGGIRQTVSMGFIREHTEWLSRFTLMHTAAYSYIDEQLPWLATLPGRLSYDFSDDFDPAYAFTLCPWLDYAFFSCAGSSLGETTRLLAQAHGAGCPIVVATRGAEGAILFDGESWLSQSPSSVTPTDTLGAGDAFITAFLLAHHRGKSLTQSLQAGADFAAVACGFNGAFGSPLVL